jgi:hypothetical protein
MWKLTQDCENDMCNREPHNRQTKLCVHHHTVYNLFLDSGMNRHLAQISATIDTSHLQTGCGSCRLAEEVGTGRRNMCNRKLARGLGLCNYHLSICSRRARETVTSLPQLVDTMEREHKEECLRLIQENERIRGNYIREAGGTSISPAPAPAPAPAPVVTNSRSVRISSSEWQRRVSSETLAEARATGARRGRAQAEARNAAQVIAPESITPSPTTPAESITRHAIESAVSIARQAARNAVELTRSVVESITPETAPESATNNTEPRVPIIRTNNMTPSQVAGLTALRRHNIDITIPEHEPDEICSICFDECSNIEPLSCGHYFHAECLSRWSHSGRSLASTCPNCRSPIINM